MAIVVVRTTYPHDDEHAHRPDLMERLHEVRLAAQEQGIDMPEDWEDGVDMPDEVTVFWHVDTEDLTMTPVQVQRGP